MTSFCVQGGRGVKKAPKPACILIQSSLTLYVCDLIWGKETFFGWNAKKFSAFKTPDFFCGDWQWFSQRYVSDYHKLFLRNKTLRMTTRWHSLGILAVNYQHILSLCGPIWELPIVCSLHPNGNADFRLPFIFMFYGTEKMRYCQITTFLSCFSLSLNTVSPSLLPTDIFVIPNPV